MKYPLLPSLFLDADGVLFDFEGAAREAGLLPSQAKDKPGFFRGLKLLPGAKEAVRELVSIEGLLVFVATKIPDENPLAATEKLQSFREHLPELQERIIITPNKGLLGTVEDILVDDRPHKANASYFRGALVHFGSKGLEGWAQVLPVLRELTSRHAQSMGAV